MRLSKINTINLSKSAFNSKAGINKEYNNCKT